MNAEQIKQNLLDTNSAKCVEAAEYIDALEKTLNEVHRRSHLLIHQNTGRWDMLIEHDRRSFGVTDSNISIIDKTLEQWGG